MSDKVTNRAVCGQLKIEIRDLEFDQVIVGPFIFRCTLFSPYFICSPQRLRSADSPIAIEVILLEHLPSSIQFHDISVVGFVIIEFIEVQHFIAVLVSLEEPCLKRFLYKNQMSNLSKIVKIVKFGKNYKIWRKL